LFLKGGDSLKIKDFAERKGLSPQAVYKALSRAGFSAKQLTDNRGNITRKGSQTLNRLFPSGDPQGKAAPDPQELPELESLKEQIKTLENRCKEWEQRYFDEVSSHKAETEQLRILISQEQQLRLASERKGLLRRLFPGKQKEGENHD
jgi:hypothetical protein